MIEPKSPEEVYEDWLSIEDTDILRDTDWIKATIASVILWAAETVYPHRDQDIDQGEHFNAFKSLAESIDSPLKS